eukprot:4451969-Heterocapsa_arctica.AAC.1
MGQAAPPGYLQVRRWSDRSPYSHPCAMRAHGAVATDDRGDRHLPPTQARWGEATNRAPA